MRRFALPGAVLAALALVYLLAWQTRPVTARPAGGPAGQTVAVTSVTRSCPPAAPGADTGHVALVAVPARPASGRQGPAVPTGSAALSAIPAGPAGAKTGREAARPATESTPSAATVLTAPGARTGGGTVVDATGQMAEGFEAEQADSSGTGLVSCPHPGSDMWFAGAGEAAAPTITLYLMNTGTLAASVNVTILTDTGQQSGLDSAITVAPGQVATADIARYARGSQALALHVQTSSGQVAAAVWEADAAGDGAWLPQAAAPATSMMIPGLTVASSSAELFVVVPGAADARLKLVAYTQSGAFPQFSSAPVEASAGATTPVVLSSLGASAAGLRVTSTVPVVAGVLVPGAGIGSFTTAVPPVTGQGVVAGNPATRGVTVGMLLTAPSGTARASIAVIGADGSVTSPAGLQEVTVRSGHTVAVAVPRPPGRAPFSIVVTPRPGSGPLYAARAVTTGTGGLTAPLAALLPVPSALASIRLPPVSDSYRAVLP